MKSTESLETLRTKVITSRRGRFGRDWANDGTNLHNDPFGRIYLLRSGRAWIRHHGQTMAMEPGFLYSIPAFTPSRYRCIEEMELSYIHYKATVSGCMEPFEYLLWPFRMRVQDEPEVERIWQMVLAADTESPGGILQADACLRLFLARFAASSKNSTVYGGDAQRFEPVFGYIEQRIHMPLRLKELAGLIHLHPTYFSNLFTETFGMSPMTYIMQRRVHRAQSLLKQSDATVQHIADMMGFKDAFYFSRVFKKITGIAPSIYRQRRHVE